MSIRNIVCLQCDDCGETSESSTDFKEMTTMARGQGWMTKKDSDDEWWHYCPECKAGHYGEY